MARSRAGILAQLGALVLLAAGLAGCGAQTSTGRSRQPSAQAQRAALTGYLHQVEPLRLAVNRLLEGADPILSAYHDRKLSPQRAGARMGQLERRFAAYTVAVNAIAPTRPPVASLQATYAHTYILEDSYLSALVVGLEEGDFDDLPDTQSEQRAAIIQWRTGLEVLARRIGFALPGDLQAAGRGEIAPSPDGS